MVVVMWFEKWLLKVALKSIVDDTRGCRVVWNALNMFEYPPSWI